MNHWPGLDSNVRVRSHECLCNVRVGSFAPALVMTQKSYTWIMTRGSKHCLVWGDTRCHMIQVETMSHHGLPLYRLLLPNPASSSKHQSVWCLSQYCPVLRHRCIMVSSTPCSHVTLNPAENYKQLWWLPTQCKAMLECNTIFLSWLTFPHQDRHTFQSQAFSKELS